MAQTFSNASVTFTMINPKDDKAKPIAHRIDYLVEQTDINALNVLGAAFATLFPDLQLESVTTNVESALTADVPPATTGSDTTVDQPTE